MKIDFVAQTVTYCATQMWNWTLRASLALHSSCRTGYM